jgi:hypothetical protein
MKTYSFDVDDAKKYGVEGAVFLYNLRFWLHLNQDKNSNYHDGKYWAYWTQKDLIERVFPFWSRQTIRRITKNLIDAGALEKSNYNKTGYDRTAWYTLGPKEYDAYMKPNNQAKCSELDSGWNQPMDWLKATHLYQMI